MGISRYTCVTDFNWLSSIKISTARVVGNLPLMIIGVAHLEWVGKYVTKFNRSCVKNGTQCCKLGPGILIISLWKKMYFLYEKKMAGFDWLSSIKISWVFWLTFEYHIDSHRRYSREMLEFSHEYKRLNSIGWSRINSLRAKPQWKLLQLPKKGILDWTQSVNLDERLDYRKTTENTIFLIELNQDKLSRCAIRHVICMFMAQWYDYGWRIPKCRLSSIKMFRVIYKQDLFFIRKWGEVTCFSLKGIVYWIHWLSCVWVSHFDCVNMVVMYILHSLPF